MARRSRSQPAARRSRSQPAARRSRQTPRRASPEKQVTSAFNRLVAERPMIAAVVLLVVVAIGWLVVRAQSDPSPSAQTPPSLAQTTTDQTLTAAQTTADQTTAPRTTTAAQTTADQRTDPASGLPVVALSSLPPEAADTVELIESDGPFPYDKDGATFGNYEGLLPDRAHGYYREYTVPTPGEGDRGARRIVAGGGEMYYTDDHYESFVLIEEDL